MAQGLMHSAGLLNKIGHGLLPPCGVTACSPALGTLVTCLLDCMAVPQASMFVLVSQSVEVKVSLPLLCSCAHRHRSRTKQPAVQG